MFLNQVLITLLLFIIPIILPGQECILISNVNIITMAEDNVLTDHHVLIRDDMIEKISRHPIELNKCVIINGQEKYLIPGLFDMHVHLERLAKENLTTFLDYGITAVRNMDGRPEILKYKKAIENNLLQGPEIFTAGPILEGENAYWEDTRKVTSSKEARAIVKEQADLGYDFIKVYHTLSHKVFSEIINEANRQNLKVGGHISNETGLLRSLELGIASIEHLDGFGDYLEASNSAYRNKWSWKKLYLAFRIDSTKVKAAVMASKKAGTAIVPTLVEKNQIDPLDKLHMKYHDPEVSLLPENIRKNWHPNNFQFINQLDGSDMKELSLGKQNRTMLIQALNKYGNIILAGSDTPNPYVLPGRSLHEELVLLVEAGLSNFEALKTATVIPAKWLCWEKHGTIEEGNIANLVLLQANPLEDISHTQSIELVIVKGALNK